MKTARVRMVPRRGGPDWERAVDRVCDTFAHGRPAMLLDRGGAVLTFPAVTATTAQLHFAIRHSCGFVHAAMPSERLDELRIPDQPVLTAEDSGLGYTAAVDAATGIGTGISAADRARTLQVLACRDTTPADLVRPGHVLPIRCADGGYDEHARIWELACDLVEDAGRGRVAVACRLITDDGDLVTGALAAEFALAHRMPLLREHP